MKECKISGWKGICSEKSNLIATYGGGFKLYDGGTHELLFRSKGIRYASGVCFNRGGNLLWAFTTESKVYALDTKTLEYAHQFRVNPGKDYESFELDSMHVPDNERYLLMTGFYRGGRMVIAYDLQEKGLHILQTAKLPDDELYSYTDNQLNIIIREIGFKDEGNALIHSNLNVYDFLGNFICEVKKTVVTDVYDEKLSSVFYLTEDKKYMLCRVYGRKKKNSPVVVYDVENCRILSGDYIPDMSWDMQAYYDEKRKLFIMVCGYEAWAIFIKNQKTESKKLYEGDGDIGDCILIKDDVLILRERMPSYLMEFDPNTLSFN